MPIRKYNPTSAGRRFQTVSAFEEVTRDRPEKSLVRALTSRGGRNNQGRMTIRRRGGGHKRAYRTVDFRREKDGIPARVASIEYDPNRSARIALLQYADGEKRYILAPQGLQVGNVVLSGTEVDIRPGNCLPLSQIPLGTMIHNIEIKPGKGGQLARSAGVGAQLMAKEGEYAQVRLASSEVRKVLARCRATVGMVGNADHENVSVGKAGRSRWKGHRPKVRGVAMNPVDHPLGGGEGKSSGGRPPVSPWGLPEGRKTRNNPATDRFIVKRRK